MLGPKPASELGLSACPKGAMSVLLQVGGVMSAPSAGLGLNPATSGLQSIARLSSLRFIVIRVVHLAGNEDFSSPGGG